MNRFLFGSVLMPAYERLLKGRRTFRYWRELERSQWQSREALERLQFSRLSELVRHSFQHCPYYRRAWSALGLDPSQLRTPADWTRWPLLQREDITAHRAEMRSGRPGSRILSKSTGGSTGIPLHFDYTSESNERRTAATFRGYSWAGAGPGTKQLFLWGVPLGRRPWRHRVKDAWWFRLNRRRVLNCFELTEERVPDFLSVYNRYRPEVLVSYTNPLYDFARMLADRGLTPRPPRSIVLGAEKVYAFQRRVIEGVFGAPVFETYGSREFMLMGAECDRHAGLHLTAENLVVEVVDDGGQPVPDGTEGNVVVTDLTNYGMPFIRYLNGDRAIGGSEMCPCGRGLPLLRRVVGRRLDIVRTPDGRRVAGELFPHLVKDYPQVRRFQVVQDRPDHVQIRLVVAPNWSESQQILMEQGVQNILGPAMRLDLLLVDDIPLTAAGKRQVVVNRCSPDAEEKTGLPQLA